MPTPPRAGNTTPRLTPCVLLRKGRICRPGPTGPEVALDPAGKPFDLFDVVDRLTAKYRMLYVVDLDGIERNQPQLDYLQELARDAEVWVDAGSATAEQVIDILVTGARRAVLSTAYLRNARELRRAWKLSTDLVFEIEMSEGHLVASDPTWRAEGARALARSARDLGLSDLVISPRGTDPDWSLIKELGSDGPVWVDGTFEESQFDRLAEAGAVGGIFHIEKELDDWEATEPK
ncbi:MAG: HisA/HisF-related TIM barrel protein [Thermoplasmata archaeon]